VGTTDSISLVRPEEAGSRVSEVYQEIRYAMGVSWVPDIFQALAAYRPYLELAWRELRPLVGRVGFERAAGAIRLHSEEAVERFPPTDHAEQLRSRRLDGDVEQIRRTVAALHFTDPRLVVMATVLHDALEGQPVGTNPDPEAGQPIDLPAFQQEIRLVRLEEAKGAPRKILEEIRQDAELLFVPAEYRALAVWPDYLEVAYYDLKPYLATYDYDQEALEIRDRAHLATAELPGPIYAGESE
jgi:Halocarboxylic acid dehydrogenase DehI